MAVDGESGANGAHEGRSYWGWGRQDAALDEVARGRLGMLVATQLDLSRIEALSPQPVDRLALPTSRLAPGRVPETVEQMLSRATPQRASHTYGKAYRDLLRGLRGDFAHAPDAVAFPGDEVDLRALLDWCEGAGVAVIPYGGGSSVVGGVEARCRDAFPAVISVDMGRLRGVTEIDVTSRAALIEAGSYGPDIDRALEPHGLSLRHYPQSYEFSTLGGWLATRAAGHFATLYTHIDDLLESLTALTPAGRIETRRLPASGAGPAPERLLLGSEGALGFIVRAWMRLQARPRFRASATFAFSDFYRGVEAVRLLSQSGLYPANCRLLDAQEALVNGLGDGTRTFLLVAFESADHPLEPWLDRASELALDAGGERGDQGSLAAALATADLVEGAAGAQDGAAGRWRKMFLRAPYLRDALVQLGLVIETFETAVTWDRFESFHRGVMRAAREATIRVCGEGLVSSRITHCYPDGAAPYFTVIAPGRPGAQLQQWDEIKAAVAEVILAAGGTITHHHAVGRDHRPWYDRERPALFGDVLAAAKHALDPRGLMNPGVLLG